MSKLKHATQTDSYLIKVDCRPLVDSVDPRVVTVAQARHQEDMWRREQEQNEYRTQNQKLPWAALR